MRIQNNITAMNTHRQYTINNDNVAKAAEKLSSGYRINRAGDDAAGLAISEKMRSQIRGLNMATKNSQDAISLVQTAEGALQETHSMLQRMNELAVQAATGTNQEEDRLALAKEFEQLKREINDIAEQTTFNNMKILDGSMSYAGYERSAATAGVTNTAVEMGANTEAPAVQNGALNEAKDPGKPAKGTFTISGGIVPTSDNSTGVGTAKVAITIGGTTVKSTNSVNLDASEGANQLAPKIRAALGTSITIDGNEYTVGGTATSIELTGKDGKVVDWTGAKLELTDLTGATDNLVLGNAVNVAAGADAGAATGGTVQNASNTVVVNPDKLKAGDTITIDGTTFELVEQGGTAATGNTAITIVGDGTDDLGALLDGKTTVGGKVTITRGADGNSFTVTANTATDKAAVTKVDFNKDKPAADKVYKNTIEFDTAKMKDGDTFKITLSDGTVGEYTYNKAEVDAAIKGTQKTAAEYVAQQMAASINGQVADSVEAKGNAIIFEGGKIAESDIKLDTDATEENASKYATNAIRIQVGALEDEQLAISIDSMNTAGLGLDGFNLDTQKNAGEAITAVRSAVQKVSDQRATLGAMQNRLDHKIANLKVSSENLSAAESRIRDVDMASEMTNFTKNNILSQAATAMLAQANSLPQNVLSLLG